MLALTDFDTDTLAAWGCKPVHARKLLRAYYDSPGGTPINALCNGTYGKQLEGRIRQMFCDRRSRVAHRHESADGTIKMLIALERTGAVETVLMPSHLPGRAAGCVSSQIGCAMGCDFCASTRNGLERDLEAGEIVEQFLSLRQAAAEQGRRLTSLVFMGMGEPMHNLANVIAAIRRIAHPDMGSLGWRQITVSTVGIVPGIRQLMDADLNVALAVSLHAPDDETRQKIIPTGKRWKVAEILAAAKEYQDKVGRIGTIEYTLLAGVNDSDAQAHLLADRMEGFRAHVNLIPVNSIGAGVSGNIYAKPAAERVERFLFLLRSRGVVAHIRRTRGDDVNAACGQLREVVFSSVSRPASPGASPHSAVLP